MNGRRAREKRLCHKLIAAAANSRIAAPSKFSLVCPTRRREAFACSTFFGRSRSYIQSSQLGSMYSSIWRAAWRRARSSRRLISFGCVDSNHVPIEVVAYSHYQLSSGAALIWRLACNPGLHGYFVHDVWILTNLFIPQTRGFVPVKSRLITTAK